VIKVIYTCTRTVDASVPSRSILGSGTEFDGCGDIETGVKSVSYLFNPEMRVFIKDLIHWARKVEAISSVNYVPFPTDLSLLDDAENLLARLVWLPPPPPTALVGKQRTNVALQSCKVPCV
jgi:hypothetical protein